MHGPVQLTRTGEIINADASSIRELQQQFAGTHCILLPSLIRPEILEILLDQIAGAQFIPDEYADVGAETRIATSQALKSLQFLLNIPTFLRFIETVTSSPPIQIFTGRIYRLSPAEGQHFDWHNDVIPDDPRLLGLSINLSPQPFEGGAFSIRDVNTKQVFREVRNTGLGDALIFRIAGSLQHSVSPVRGPISRTAYAGWFKPPTATSSDDFHQFVRTRVSLV
jgi:hypothetical protein